jgi:hypothetical protein
MSKTGPFEFSENCRIGNPNPFFTTKYAIAPLGFEIGERVVDDRILDRYTIVF